MDTIISRAPISSGITARTLRKIIWLGLTWLRFIVCDIINRFLRLGCLAFSTRMSCLDSIPLVLINVGGILPWHHVHGISCRWLILAIEIPWSSCHITRVALIRPHAAIRSALAVSYKTCWGKFGLSWSS